MKQGQKCGAKKAEVLTVGTHVSQRLCARLFPRDPVGNAKISQRIYLPNMLIHTNPFCEQVIYTCSKKDQHSCASNDQNCVSEWLQTLDHPSLPLHTVIISGQHYKNGRALLKPPGFIEIFQRTCWKKESMLNIGPRILDITLVLDDCAPRDLCPVSEFWPWPCR